MARDPASKQRAGRRAPGSSQVRHTITLRYLIHPSTGRLAARGAGAGKQAVTLPAGRPHAPRPAAFNGPARHVRLRRAARRACARRHAAATRRLAPPARAAAAASGPPCASCQTAARTPARTLPGITPALGAGPASRTSRQPAPQQRVRHAPGTQARV